MIPWNVLFTFINSLLLGVTMKSPYVVPVGPDGNVVAPARKIKLFSNLLFLRPQASSAEETDFDQSDMLILPPPDLYADLTRE